MASFSTNGKNAMLDALAALAKYVSVHDDSPGDNGANEISGGAPAYARKSITWNGAASGILDSSNQPQFDIPAGTYVKYIGFWSAVSGGTFYGYGQVDEAYFANQGTYTLTDSDLDLNG